MTRDPDIIAVELPGRGYKPPRTDRTRSPDHLNPFVFAMLAVALVTSVTIMIVGLP